MSHTWSNWSKTVRATPIDVIRPWTTEALERAVNEALAQGRRVKAVGTGHSFTGIAAADDVQLDLSNYTGIVAFDQRAGRITLRSGTRLWQIPRLLEGSGWAMENLGDIDQQSIAGAIATGTHGTGLGFGGLASQVVGFELLTGCGPRTVSDEQEVEVLDALRVSLGALGIITTVTLQLVPEYDLHTVQTRCSLKSVLDNWQALNAQHDHFEFFWFGHATEVQTKSSQRLPVQRATTTLWDNAKQWVDDELIANGGLAVISQLGRHNNQWLPALNRFALRAWGSGEATTHWSSAFASPRRVRFNEMEYALPFETIPDVVCELQKLFCRKNLGSAFPLEIRAAAPDTAWLATNHARPTGYIAVHQHYQQDYRRYFAHIEPILRAAGGRPHWGKLHTLDVEEFAELYPRWHQVQQLRDTYDPERSFTNAYLTRVLGA